MDWPVVPEGFINLRDASLTENRKYNIIGVCTDFLPAALSRGTDFTMKLNLKDPQWSGHHNGFTVRLFNKSLEWFPPITKPGDVLILKNLKTKAVGISFAGISNPETTWTHLSFETLSTSTCPQGSDIIPIRSGLNSYQPPLPTTAEALYAKGILELENPDTFVTPQPSIRQIGGANRGIINISSTSVTKFRLIQDIIPPTGKRELIYVEILGEVRKLFKNDFRVEISVTDYTENLLLYNYKHPDQNGGQDGDDHGYLSEKMNQWRGPWGKMTMTIVLWDQNSQYARHSVQEGSFVYLRNVQIVLDKNGLKLEGHCRGDRLRDRVNVSIYKPSMPGKHEKAAFEALIERKQEYEQKAKGKNMKFVRDLHEVKKVTKVKLEDKFEVEKETENKAASKKSRRKENKEGKGRHKKLKLEAGDNAKKGSSFHLNTNVRCKNVEVPLKSISDILDSENLRRDTAQGNEFYLPFQNCCYKSKVRVVDYFPENIADFAVPYRESEDENLSEVDDYDYNGSDVVMTGDENGKIKWRWCFFLLVEDAKPRLQSKGEDPSRIELLVADTDGEFLLRREACDLRDPKNSSKLNQLRELVLFHLWGDLAEIKEEARSTGQSCTLKPQAQPFECLIKEYGIPVRQDDGKYEKSTSYERMFRIFGTSIQ